MTNEGTTKAASYPAGVVQVSNLPPVSRPRRSARATCAARGKLETCPTPAPRTLGRPVRHSLIRHSSFPPLTSPPPRGRNRGETTREGVPIDGWLDRLAAEFFAPAVRNYWVIEACHVVLLAAAGYLLGLLVVHRGWRVNYTRKLSHFVLFAVPFLLRPVLPYEGEIWMFAVSAAVFLVQIAFLAPPVRRRIPALETIFASVDRPEDRPHTLWWIVTQALATYAVMIGVVVWLGAWYGEAAAGLILIPVLITAVGDGLAEPVGVRFGRHRYSVRALGTSKRYTRSLEGSACVFVTSILVTVGVNWLAAHRGFPPPFPGWRLGLAVILIPAAMTLAEAFSPHSWDAPFLYAVGGACVALLLAL